MTKRLFALSLTFALLLSLQAQAKCMNCAPQPAPEQPRLVGQAAPQIDFAKSIEDLPLMPGLSVDTDKDLMFVIGKQRIAQTTLRGYVDVDQVYYFYWRTLKEMGWRDAGRNVYERDSERMTMKVSSANAAGQTLVTFTLDPVKHK